MRQQLLENINFIAKFTQEILGQAILKWNQYQIFSTQYETSPIYLEIFQIDSSISSVGRGTPGPIVRWLNASFVPSEFRPIYHTIINESRITLTLQIIYISFTPESSQYKKKRKKKTILNNYFSGAQFDGCLWRDMFYEEIYKVF